MLGNRGQMMEVVGIFPLLISPTLFHPPSQTFDTTTEGKFDSCPTPKSQYLFTGSIQMQFFQIVMS